MVPIKMYFYLITKKPISCLMPATTIGLELAIGPHQHLQMQDLEQLNIKNI